jgi:hypothetical protein
MNDITVLGAVKHLAEHLTVPSLRQKEHTIGAEDIKVVLVLRNSAVVHAKKLYETLENIIFSKTLTIDEQ